MPQMSPISWLSIMTMLCFMIIITLSNFHATKVTPQNKILMNNKNKPLMW